MSVIGVTTESMDNLAWLACWYGEQCNGSWENTHGLRLDKLAGHPGLARRPHVRLTVELAGTSAAIRQSRSLLLTSTQGTRLRCSLTSEQFRGEGDAARLEQIIGVFRRWVVQAARPAASAAKAAVYVGR